MAVAATKHTTDLAPRCEAVNAMTGKPCGRMLAVMVTRPWMLDCPRCHMRNERGIDKVPKQVLESA